MTRRGARTLVGSLLCLLTFATSASAECAWVLWVESPAGSDQWSVATVPQARFTATIVSDRPTTSTPSNGLWPGRGRARSSCA
jgi:hypothetical protein